MTQWLKCLLLLQQNLNSVPSTQVSSQIPTTPAPEDLTPFFGLGRHACRCTYPHIEMNTYLQFKIKSQKKNRTVGMLTVKIVTVKLKGYAYFY